MRLRASIKERIPQVLFGMALSLLVLMAGWWFFFMAHSVSQEDGLWREKVVLEQRLLALELAATSEPVRLGAVAEDPRFVVTPSGSGGLAVPGKSLEVLVDPNVAREHAFALARRKSMVYGEGSFLLVLVLTCVVMLYRLVLAEQRYRRDIESFLARVTHEMKTPLAGLKALLQTLRAGRVPDERLKELAEMGMRQAEREEHLIENLLLAHKLATRSEALHVADLDVAKVLADFVAHRRATMGLSEGELEVSAEPGLMARGNAGAIGTILENLADNAFKYGARSVRLTAHAHASGIAVHVQDDGMGFEPGTSERLFQPFQRDASASQGRHGTGLGLPISRQLAKELGGSLSADSQGPGKGSRFTLMLPAGRPHPAARPAAATEVSP